MRRPRPLVAGGVATVVLGASLVTVGLVRGHAHGSVVPASTTVAADLGPAPLAEPDDPGQAGSRALQVVPTTPPTAAPAPTGGVSPSRPRSAPTLEVPAIGLDVPVESGGVSASGSVVPPAGRAVWVQGFGRVAPGDMGTAVIAGHVVAYGRDDVFTELRSVRVGHEVRVTADGVTRIFVVRRTTVVTKAALTRDADVWGANTSTRRVVLITCDDDLGYRPDGHRVANYVVVAEAV